MTAKSTVSQAELTRCLKAVRAAGFAAARVSITRPDGTTVSIVAGEAVDNPDNIDAMIDRVPNASTS